MGSNYHTTTDITLAVQEVVQYALDASERAEFNIEAAVQAIANGEVTPWVEAEPDTPELTALALATVMDDGPWWTVEGN